MLSKGSIVNSAAQEQLVGPEPNRDPLAFHRRLTGYAPTKMVQAQKLADQMGVKQIFVKDESFRFGLPAFKILGASWAVYRTMVQLANVDSFGNWETIEDLKTAVSRLKPLTLVAATDGNHGRAVAHMAALLGLDSHIFVPDDMVPARRAAIESEGAKLTVIDGTYDDAIERSANEASRTNLVISDTSWPGYEDVPRWVTDGYSTIFWEIDDQLSELSAPLPDIVAVQIGVGALAKAVVQHYRRAASVKKTRIVGVEPVDAACVFSSILAGQIVSVPGPHHSIMAGLNCGVPSLTAWPVLYRGLDVMMAIEDDYARQSMRALRSELIVAGETGASGFGGIIKLLESPDARHARNALNISKETTILVISTEGATDPQSYESIVGLQS